mgnify:CR=1 FL=1
MDYQHPAIEQLFLGLEEGISKAVDYMKSEYSLVRPGRANPKLLERIYVDYYGTNTPVHQMSNISSPEPRQLVITLWDKSMLGKVEKAILAANIGVTPQNDGTVIRLTFPELTEERRRDLVKQVKKYGEEAKVAVRNIRRDAMDKFKAQKKKSEITEDDLKIIEKDLQKLTDDYIKEVERIADEKEKELMEI